MDPRHDRKTAYEKKSQKTKCVSNDGSGHDDSNGPRIVKIGAILAILGHFKVLQIYSWRVATSGQGKVFQGSIKKTKFEGLTISCTGGASPQTCSQKSAGV